MTWVIGASTTFGYGIALSDLCVTYEGKTADVLQKIYPLAPFVVGGFAGSVKIGFNLLTNLNQFLKPPEKNIGWKLDWVVDTWSSAAKYIFDHSEDNEKKVGSHILLMAAHPTEDVGIPGWPRIHVATLKSPSFKPQIKPDAFLAIDHIGSGESAYESIITNIIKDSGNIMKGEMGVSGGMGHMISAILTNAIEKHPVTGISQHLQHIIVRRGDFAVGNNNYTKIDRKGNKTIFSMPQVAQNYQELLEKLNLESGASVITA